MAWSETKFTSYGLDFNPVIFPLSRAQFRLHKHTDNSEKGRSQRLSLEEAPGSHAHLPGSCSFLLALSQTSTSLFGLCGLHKPEVPCQTVR